MNCYLLKDNLLIKTLQIDTGVAIYINLETSPFFLVLNNLLPTIYPSSQYEITIDQSHAIIRLIFRRLQEKIKEIT